MTPAIKLLEKQGIKHAVHPYDHDPNSEAYGLEAAEKIGVPYAQVFKTLLVALEGDAKKLAVGIVPVDKQLNLKANKVDPRVCVLARNLLSNDDCRAALFDEVMEGWPQVPLVSKPSSFACRAERLARTGTSPNRSVVCPSCRSQGMGPDANAGEEMALREAAQVAGEDIFDTPFIHIARRNVAGFNQVAQPLRGCRVDFVVVERIVDWSTLTLRRM